MAKGVVGSATEAVKAVAKTALGAAATAAATVVIENVARSIAKKRGGPLPELSTQPVTAMPVVEDAVRELLTAAPPKKRKSSSPKRAESRSPAVWSGSRSAR